MEDEEHTQAVSTRPHMETIGHTPSPQHRFLFGRQQGDERPTSQMQTVRANTSSDDGGGAHGAPLTIFLSFYSKLLARTTVVHGGRGEDVVDQRGRIVVTLFDDHALWPTATTS